MYMYLYTNTCIVYLSILKMENSIRNIQTTASIYIDYIEYMDFLL